MSIAADHGNRQESKATFVIQAQPKLALVFIKNLLPRVSPGLLPDLQITPTVTAISSRDSVGANVFDIYNKIMGAISVQVNYLEARVPVGLGVTQLLAACTNRVDGFSSFRWELAVYGGVLRGSGNCGRHHA